VQSQLGDGRHLNLNEMSKESEQTEELRARALQLGWIIRQNPPDVEYPVQPLCLSAEEHRETPLVISQESLYPISAPLQSSGES